MRSWNHLVSVEIILFYLVLLQLLEFMRPKDLGFSMHQLFLGFGPFNFSLNSN